jgi:hypothetical protein
VFRAEMENIFFAFLFLVSVWIEGAVQACEYGTMLLHDRVVTQARTAPSGTICPIMTQIGMEMNWLAITATRSSPIAKTYVLYNNEHRFKSNQKFKF